MRYYIETIFGETIEVLKSEFYLHAILGFVVCFGLCFALFGLILTNFSLVF